MDNEPYDPEPFFMDDDEAEILSAYTDTGKRVRSEQEQPFVEAPSVREPTTPVHQVGERKRPRFSADSPSEDSSDSSSDSDSSEDLQAEISEEEKPAPVPFRQMLANRVAHVPTPQSETRVADTMSYTDEPIFVYGEAGGRKGLSDLVGTSRKENADLRRKQAGVVNVVLPGGYVGNVRVPTNIKDFTKGDEKFTPTYIIKAFTDSSGHSIAANRDHPHTFPSLGRGRHVVKTPLALPDAWKKPGFELLACTVGIVQRMEKQYQENEDFRRSLHERVGTMRSEPSLQEVRDAILTVYMGGEILFSAVQNNEEEGHVVPRFNVVYRMEQLWRLPATVLMNPTAEMKQSPVYDRVRKHYNIIASTYSLTNGCLAGQINRLLDTTRVKNEVMQRTPNRFYDSSTFDKIDELLGINTAIPQIHDLETWYRILTPGSSMGWSDEEEVDKLFRYEPTASAGLIWVGNQKRDQVILADVQYNQSVMEFVLGAEGFDDMRTFFKVFQEMMDRVKIVQIKPKFEITKIAKVRDKVRNIFVYPSCYQVALGCFCQKFKSFLPMPMERGGSSLAGFTPMYGSLNIVVKITMMKCEEDGAYSGAFYSDNSYFVKRVSENSYKWFSTDVEKMESTSTVEEGRMTMEYMMRVTGLPSTSALYQYLRYMGGDFSHDAVGVLGNMLIQVPGLSSGSQTTFLTNHIRMARAYSIMLPLVAETGVLDTLKDGDKVPFDYKENQIYFNLELTTTSDFTPIPGSIYEGIRFVPLKMEYDDDECGTLTTFGGIVRLDMLGFDGTVVSLDQGEFPEDDPYTICACLDYERLMKAIAFRKTTPAEQKDEKIGVVTNFVNLIVEIMTMQTLYIVGGYAYPEAHMLIRKIVHLIIGYVQEAVNRITTYSNEHNWSDEERRNRFTNLVLEHSEQFLGGSDSGNSRFISDDVKSQLAATVTKNVDAIFNRDFTAIEKFTTRESVITHFHTIRGKREREAEVNRKLRMLRAKHGGGSSKAAAITSARNVDGEVAFHNIGI